MIKHEIFEILQEAIEKLELLDSDEISNDEFSTLHYFIETLEEVQGEVQGEIEDE